MATQRDKSSIYVEVYDFWSFCDYKMNFIGCKTGTWQEDWVTRLKTKIV